MKKGIVFVLLSAFSLCSFAQQANHVASKLAGKEFSVPLSNPQRYVNQTQSVNSFYIDYDSADASIYGPANYTRYVWPMNNYYTSSDSAIRYCIVAFDSLFDAYSDTGYFSDSVANLAVDSIFLMLGHENNSGYDDTLIVKIIGLDTVRGYPLPNNIYWTTTLIIPAGTPLSGNWKMPVVQKFITFTSVPDNRFAIMVEYYGSRMDTLGIVAGFGFRDSCATANVPDADSTHFSSVRKLSSGDSFLANSFALWSEYQFIGLLPTQNGSNIYFDCDSNGQYIGGIDGESYIQNIQFIAHVKTNASGVNEEADINLHVEQNRPNPFNDLTTVYYSLKENSTVLFEVSDITGKNILSRSEENRSQGAHSLTFDGNELEAGLYFYTITAGKTRVTKKMVIVK